MNQSNLTAEQIADIKTRETEALEVLKKLELTPAAVVQKTNIGDDIFADKVTCYLQDIKYLNENSKKTEESLETK